MMTESLVRCPNCQTEVQAGQKFCPECGCSPGGRLLELRRRPATGRKVLRGVRHADDDG